MKEEDKERAKEFAKTLKNNPKAIIRWAKREIQAYEALIEILEKGETTGKRD